MTQICMWLGCFLKRNTMTNMFLKISNLLIVLLNTQHCLDLHCLPTPSVIYRQVAWMSLVWSIDLPFSCPASVIHDPWLKITKNIKLFSKCTPNFCELIIFSQTQLLEHTCCRHNHVTRMAYKTQCFCIHVGINFFSCWRNIRFMVL